MNRLSQRRIRYSSGPHPIRALAAELLPEVEPEWLKDLRLFAIGWLAGLVFFGTLLA